MRIAIIGGGVSGLVAARILATRHDVLLFEAADYPGGHARTVDVSVFGHDYSVDVGFMVFNRQTYPNFCHLLQILGVKSQASDMSFSVSCERTGLEYEGGSLRGLFAQANNFFRPAHYRFLLEIIRFNRLAFRLLERPCQKNLGTFLDHHKFSRSFQQHYLLPMTAAIWSSKPATVLEFPTSFLFRFMANHGLLQLSDRPQWLTIQGGSRRYVEKLVEPLATRIRLNSPISQVLRNDDQVYVTGQDGETEIFDAVVFATHADTTLRILSDATDLEVSTLGTFKYQKNMAILHTDSSMLPQGKRAWASWNYRVSGSPAEPATVTYDLSRLQNINSPSPLMVTLNPSRGVRQECILRQFTFHHPVFSEDTPEAQSRIQAVNGQLNTYFCGAYHRYGFHEDGVVSALKVTKQFGLGIDSCAVACISDKSHTVGSPQ